MRLGGPIDQLVSDPKATEALKQLKKSAETAFHIEHNIDDTHGTIHASGAVYERGRTAAAMGESIAVTFAPGLYTASGGMLWGVVVGSQTTLVYTLIGKWMIVAFDIVNSSVTAPLSSTLQITIPGSFVAKRTVVGTCYYSDNGTAGIGRVFVAAGASIMSILTLAAGNWTASVNNTTVQGELAFEVQ